MQPSTPNKAAAIIEVCTINSSAKFNGAQIKLEDPMNSLSNFPINAEIKSGFLNRLNFIIEIKAPIPEVEDAISQFREMIRTMPKG